MGGVMTYPETECFWLEFADLAEYGLRRYTDGGKSERTPDGKYLYGCAQGCHDSEPVIIGQHPAGKFEDNNGRTIMAIDSRKSQIAWPGHDDQRWPVECQRGSGYRFAETDQWQQWTDMLYRRSGTGELMTLRSALPGAMWDAFWYPWKGPDGRSLVAKCPNSSDWMIDSRANNCTMPTDTQHRCWVRHGEPPKITVDKNGNTCAAGAGSIQAGDYHGFLRDGRFAAG